MRPISHVVAACAAPLLLAAACGDATLVRVSGDLEVPAQLDGLCLAVSDSDPSGGEFARFYVLGGDLDGLPQSLAVDPGQAASAEARVRGYLGGVEVARDRGITDFGGGELDLELARCPGGNRGAAAVVGTAPAPADAVLAASYGRGGTVLVAVGAGEEVTLRAAAGQLADAGVTVPAAPAMAPTALVPFDADGDCDDDLVVLLADAPPVLWRRDGTDTFAAADDAFPSIGLDITRAAAAADIDGDGDLDLALGGSSLRILRNDGTGRFQVDTAAAPPGAVTDVTALAFGDIDGDGHVDLVVGQGDTAAAPARVLLNDTAGAGFFEVAAAALPEVPLQTRAIALTDVNGDGARDLVVGALGTNIRLYVNRGDGRLEDRSFVSLPDIDARDVTSLAVADWTGDCLVDLVAGVTGAAPVTWRGADGDKLVADSVDQDVSGDRVLLVDLDDDGDRDLIVGGPDGVTWVRRQ